MQEKIDKAEILRQLLHILFGSAFIAMVAFFGVNPTLNVLVACFAAGAIISLLIKNGKKVPFFSKFVKVAGRGAETSFPGQGALTFFLGAIILMGLFSEQKIVLGALIVLVYGDGFSTLAGKSFGKTRLPNNKTLEGSAAGVIVSAALLANFFTLPVAIITAIVGMLAELLPIDDNLTIPIASAAALTFLISL